MVLGAPFGSALNYSFPSFDDLPYRNGADSRLPTTTDAVPDVRVEARTVLYLTDPNGVAVTFLVGEALPAWAQPFR